jgi:hypothetical protein
MERRYGEPVRRVREREREKSARKKQNKERGARKKEVQ